MRQHFDETPAAVPPPGLGTNPAAAAAAAAAAAHASRLPCVALPRRPPPPGANALSQQRSAGHPAVGVAFIWHASREGAVLDATINGREQARHLFEAGHHAGHLGPPSNEGQCRDQNQSLGLGIVLVSACWDQHANSPS